MKQPTPEKIKGIFDRYYQADIKYWKEFSKYLEVRYFNKNEIIKDYYKTERYINILISGSVAHFVPNKHKDICINIYYENDIFSDYLSFLTQESSAVKTKSIEDTVVWSITFENLQNLYRKANESILIGKAISDLLFIKKQSEQINLLTRSPTERYLNLLKEKPLIFRRTPLKIIASYLGITPESLSRIRKTIS